VSLFIENGAKAKLSIYHQLLSNSEEFKRLTGSIKSTEYSYLQRSRFINPCRKEDVSLSQICILGHGFNEDIYLIGRNFDIGVIEKTLYATFSYSQEPPIEFIIVPMWKYSEKVKDKITEFFSKVVKEKEKSFQWQSLIENPYNKVYDELINRFSGNSVIIDNHFIEYRISE
jgi:hypothetical protein